MSTLDLIAAAAYLGIHEDTLRERAADGTVRGAKIGRSWRFLESDLLEYFGRITRGAPPGRLAAVVGTRPC
jgi:excisionase family DNA binding protein